MDPLWTMPGHLAQHGRLTHSVTYLVDNAQVLGGLLDVQLPAVIGAVEGAATSGAAAGDLDEGLHGHATRPTPAARRAWSPTTDEVAAHLRPALVLRTKAFDGRQVRNHSKFLSIDHRFLLVTSANFSWSAENANLEFGVLIDNSNLAESVERELRDAEDLVFERVMQRADHLP